MELSINAGEVRAAARLRPTTQRQQRDHRRTAKLLPRLFWLAYTTGLFSLLYFGWINRLERHWTPEKGFGYWLGIAGAGAMLLLLVYPLRKRFKWLRFLGRIPAWFRLHMALGLLGPALILLHCNFTTGSLNASVALYSMLIVAGSGLIGRFLYAHVHSSWSGQRLAATSFFEDAHRDKVEPADAAMPRISLPPEAVTRVKEITQRALSPPSGLIPAIGHSYLTRWQTRNLERALSRGIRRASRDYAGRDYAGRGQNGSGRMRNKQVRQLEREISHHLAAVRKSASLAVYERLFALWHFLHLPLFIMLVLAAIAHVIAVHLY